jgi:isochorismate pyruvate lyase
MLSYPSKLPEDCESLDEIRAQIDSIDRSIIEAIGRRKAYVLAVVKFKKSLDEVPAPERVSSMLQTRREWAKEVGVNPDVIEKLYRDLVDHFIVEQSAHWEGGDPGPLSED